MPSGMRLPATPGLGSPEPAGTRGHARAALVQLPACPAGKGWQEAGSLPSHQAKAETHPTRAGSHASVLIRSRARWQLLSQSATSQTCWLFNPRQGLF